MAGRARFVFLLGLLACREPRGQGAAAAPAPAEAARTPAADGAPAPAEPPDAASERVGCAGARLLAAAADPAAPGPWPVGVRTANVAGLRVEIWYPARPGSEAGVAPAIYDLRDVLPAGAAAAVTDDEAPRAPCACFRDLPLDDAHGPYPLVLFVHGLGLWRWESVTLTAHWASRGFVVVAADHPGATLADLLEKKPRRDPTPDAARLLDAFAEPAAEPGLAFLAGSLDSRLGVTGHSLGAEVASRLSATRGDVIVAMAEVGVARSKRRFVTLIVGGMADDIMPYKGQQRGYASSPAPKRLVGLAGVGHMSFSDVCSAERDRGGLIAAARAAGVAMSGFVDKLATRGCKIPLDPDLAWSAIKRVTTAGLEEVLFCDAAAAAWFDPVGEQIGELKQETGNGQ